MAVAMDQPVSLPTGPHQPRSFSFPKRTFGKKAPVNRSFQASWFESHSWLHYDEANDAAFCYICMKAAKENKLTRCIVDQAFTTKGYINWKDAKVNFKEHEATNCHKEAVQMITVIPSCYKDCGELLSIQHAQEKADNRQLFIKLLQSVQHLAEEGLPLRGDGVDKGNFFHLLKLRARDDHRFVDWMKKKTNKYTSPEIQNEILSIMSCSVLRGITECVQNASFFTIMIDETTDVANKEQVVLVLRWVDQDLIVHEKFVGLYVVPSISADTLVSVIKDSLSRLNLSLSKVRGQCYDGASNMRGAKKGVAKQIYDEESRAVYTHCYGHALNLACGDSIKRCKLLKDTLDNTHEITKLIKFSPKREVVFQEKKQELAPDVPGMRVLCPTRWTVRADSLESIFVNYKVLQETFEISKDQVSDTEIKSRIIGIISQMKTFDYFFGVKLGELILNHTDNLSKSLQNLKISAAEGQELARLTTSTLQSIRDEKMFDLFWSKVLKLHEDVDVDPPILPRRRKAPKRYDDGAEPFYPETPKQLYHKSYFESLDLVVSSIQDRFDQPGYATYRNVEEILLKAAHAMEYETELTAVIQFYGSDLERSQLQTQLQSLTVHFDGYDTSKRSTISLNEILEYLRSLSEAQRAYYSQVVILTKLLLVMPASNATSERSFSALRRVKTYLRSTMSQARLNNLMTLHVHQDLTDQLNLVDIANEFVNSKPEHTMQIFGRFSVEELIGVSVCTTCGKTVNCNSCKSTCH